MANGKFRTGISITHEEKAIVDEYQEKNGGSFSHNLGMIIREWADMKDSVVSIPKAAIVTEDGKTILDPKYWETKKGVDQSR